MKRNRGDFNSPINSDHKTILMWAIEKGNCDIMNHILSENVDVNIQDKDGNTALLIAQKIGDIEKIKLLMKHGANLDLVKGKVSKKTYKKLLIIYQSIQGEKYSGMKRIGNVKNSIINKQHLYEEFKYAIISNNIEKIRMLLEKRNSKGERIININEKLRFQIINREFLPIEIAVSKGHIEIVKLLLNCPDIKVKSTIISIAVVREKISIAKILINNPKIDINETDDEGNTPLIYAAGTGQIEILKFLLDQPHINVNIQNNNDNTALMFGVVNNQIEIVKLLLNKRNSKGQRICDVNIKGKKKFAILNKRVDIDPNNEKFLDLLQNNFKFSKFTPLLIAVYENHVELVKILLSHPDIEVNEKDTLRELTALLLATSMGNTEMVKLLLDHPKININIQDKNGYTALAYAVLDNYTEIIKLLLNKKDENGKRIANLYVNHKFNWKLKFHNESEEEKEEGDEKIYSC
eukprot:jgi/Orpsp1_1/1192913/evm.model.d7180000096881.1